MGLRLYVTTSEEKDKCFGKLFGYPGDAKTHFYSLDYLIEIDAFKKWQEDLSTWDTTSYDDMMQLFNCSQATDDIYLTPEQYNRFILLYRSDQLNRWGHSLKTFSNLMTKLFIKAKTRKSNSNGVKGVII